MSNSTAQGRFRIADGGFALDGKPFKFVGINLRELAYYGYKPWGTAQHAKEKYIDVQLDKAREMRAQVVRVYGAYRADKNGVDKDDKSVTDIDEAIKRLQKVLKKCQERDLFALVTLDDAKNSGFFVGCDSGKYRPARPSQYYTMDYYKTGYQDTYIPFIDKVVAELKGHPALFAWGVCNEVQVYPHKDYADQMLAVSRIFLDYFTATSKRLRQLDPYTLITTSIEACHHIFVEHAYQGKNFADQLYKLPTIDFATMHTYRDKRRMDVVLGHNDGHIPIEVKRAQTVWKKPIIMEEIGPTGGKNRPNGGDWLSGALGELFNLGFSGAMQWGFSGTTDGNIGVGDDDSGMHIRGDGLPTGDWGKMYEVYQHWGNQFWRENAGDWDGELPEIVVDNNLRVDPIDTGNKEPKRTKTMLMEVVNRVRVRTEPRVATETMVEWRETGSQFEVKADVVEEADGFIWRQHTDTGNWSAEKETDGTLYLLQVIAPYVAVAPETVAPETVKMTAVATANIRPQPTTSAADVGDVLVGDVVEVFPGERIIADNYVWLRHSDNRWSVQVKISTGTVYLERVSQGGMVDKLTGGIDVSDLIDDTVEAVKTTILMDVVQQVEVRKEPKQSATIIETLEAGAQAEVKIDVVEEADGYIWRQHVESGYWSAQNQVDGKVYLLEILELHTSSDPDAASSETVKMQVQIDVRIRDSAGLTGNRIGSLSAGKFVDVYHMERNISGNYVWLRHGENQWSAQIDTSDGEVYLKRVEQSVIDSFADTDIKVVGEYGAGFRSVFQQLPMSLVSTQWFYYYGNTVIAYKCRDIYGYGYARGIHAGLDFGSTKSAIIVAGVEGVVTKIETAKTAQHKVWVKTQHNTIIYQHVWNEKVGVGQTVGPETAIAEVMPTSAGGLNHLHLEVRNAGGSEVYNPLMMMPPNMSDSLINKYPAENAAGFLTKFGQYLSPLDQPIIQISKANYDNPLVPNGFLSQAELDAIPYGC